MTSTDATQAVKALWWLVLIRGVLAVLFGLYALFSPAAALLALVFVFGFYAIMDGVAAIAVGFRHRRTSHWGWHVVLGVTEIVEAFHARRLGSSSWGWLLVGGIVGILFGIVLFSSPAAGAL